MFNEYKNYWVKIGTSSEICTFVAGLFSCCVLFFCFAILWIGVLSGEFGVHEAFIVMLYPLPLYAPHLVLFWMHVRGSRAKDKDSDNV